MRWSPLFKDCITNTDDPIQNPESPNSQSRQFSGAGTCENVCHHPLPQEFTVQQPDP